MREWAPFSAFDLEKLRHTHVFLVKARVGLNTTLEDLRSSNRPGAIIRVRDFDDFHILPMQALTLPVELTDPTLLTVLLQESWDMVIPPGGEPYQEVR